MDHTSLQRTKEDLHSLKVESENWNEPDCFPITSGTVEEAVRFAGEILPYTNYEDYHVWARADGSINFEWRKNQKSLFVSVYHDDFLIVYMSNPWAKWHCDVDGAVALCKQFLRQEDI